MPDIGKSRFTAELPTAGPTCAPGASLQRSSVISISGTASLQRTACAIGCLPVKVKNGYYVPSASGNQCSVSDAVELDEIKDDNQAEFAINVKPDLWSAVDGVLVVLLYDMDMGGSTFFRRLKRTFSKVTSFLSPALGKLKCPPQGRSAMCQAIEQLLKTPVSTLRAGLVTIGP